MLRQNKVLTGVLVGLIFPVIIFVLLWEINIMLVDNRLMPNEGFRVQFLCVLSVVSNVIPAGMYLKAKKDNALKGNVAVTLLLVAAVLIYFNKTILQGLT